MSVPDGRTSGGSTVRGAPEGGRLAGDPTSGTSAGDAG